MIQVVDICKKAALAAGSSPWCSPGASINHNQGSTRGPPTQRIEAASYQEAKQPTMAKFMGPTGLLMVTPGRLGTGSSARASIPKKLATLHERQHQLVTFKWKLRVQEMNNQHYH
eukprot:1140380-Pelagomonas_calceolata.AAC.1